MNHDKVLFSFKSKINFVWNEHLKIKINNDINKYNILEDVQIS